jgi:hypothetical protein
MPLCTTDNGKENVQGFQQRLSLSLSLSLKKNEREGRKGHRRDFSSSNHYLFSMEVDFPHVVDMQNAADSRSHHRHPHDIYRYESFRNAKKPPQAVEM